VIPAVTHVDNSARLQTVHQETNPKFHALLTRFFETTGCPLLVNTSFNVRGEPIVCTPADAYHCFMATHMDILVIGNYLLIKDEQPDQSSADLDSYLGAFPLD
jgi:carbamoyltransferase